VLTWGYGGHGEMGNGDKAKPAYNLKPQFAHLPEGIYASSIDAGVYSVLAVSGPQPITSRRSKDPVVEAHEHQAEIQPVAGVLRCINTAAAILDVYRDGNRVRIIGVAAPGYTGKRVEIRFQDTNRVVGFTTVAADSRFAVSVPAPASSQLGKDTTRYRAELDGGEPSPWVKLTRRLKITSITRNGDTMTVKGEVIGPFASGTDEHEKIRLIQSQVCKDRKEVGSQKPDGDGNVTYTFPAPGDVGTGHVFYRMDGAVGASDPGEKDIETNSLGVVFAL
jgi:hypothetical protein